MQQRQRKKSGFKDFSSIFWVNERSKFGCKYQCKGCGKVTLGHSGGDTERRMHLSTCERIVELDEILAKREACESS